MLNARGSVSALRNRDRQGAVGDAIGSCGILVVRKDPVSPMKAGIHPAYEEVTVTCACGNAFKTRSTHKGDIRVEICSNCHPFFTGRQKLVDTEGRVDRFQKKVQKSKDMQAASAKKTAKKKEPVAQ